MVHPFGGFHVGSVCQKVGGKRFTRVKGWARFQGGGRSLAFWRNSWGVCLEDLLVLNDLRMHGRWSGKGRKRKMFKGERE